ncbi:hypothetical protein EDB92DRAFT_1815074 [Lactarius akahatsu]|uniref:Uncharacterized protein n=1 Tax=Lactarius akahatsu TaxID=416441 RepID=A0AAD4LNB2_9AGAM|nr:hypothetical protein EDB92DRAFT_1815074 [Lactarius akahatsu]
MRLFIGGDHMIEVTRTALRKLHTLPSAPKLVKTYPLKDLERNWSNAGQIIDVLHGFVVRGKVLFPLRRCSGFNTAWPRPEPKYNTISDEEGALDDGGNNQLCHHTLHVTLPGWVSALIQYPTAPAEPSLRGLAHYQLLGSVESLSKVNDTVRNERVELLAVEASSDQSQGSTQVKQGCGTSELLDEDRNYRGFRPFGSQPVPNKEEGRSWMGRTHIT